MGTYGQQLPPTSCSIVGSSWTSSLAWGLLLHGLSMGYGLLQATSTAAFLFHLPEASCLQILILMGDINHPESNIEGSKQSWRLLEYVVDKLLIQNLIRVEAFLDLVLTNAEELIKEIKKGGTLPSPGRVCDLEEYGIRRVNSRP